MHRSCPSIRVIAVALLLSICALASAQATDADQAKKQALELFDIFKAKNWVRLYAITEFSPAVKKTLTDADSFAKGFAQGVKESDPTDNFTKLFSSMTDIHVGTAVIENGHAYIAATSKIKMPDSPTVTLMGVITLVKVGSAWKWDLSFGDDSEKVTAQRTTEFLGEPITGS